VRLLRHWPNEKNGEQHGTKGNLEHEMEEPETPPNVLDTMKVPSAVMESRCDEKRRCGLLQRCEALQLGLGGT
jgi:hypothetical protein